MHVHALQLVGIVMSCSWMLCCVSFIHSCDKTRRQWPHQFLWCKSCGIIPKTSSPPPPTHSKVVVLHQFMAFAFFICLKLQATPCPWARHLIGSIAERSLGCDIPFPCSPVVTKWGPTNLPHLSFPKVFHHCHWLGPI